MVYDVTVDGDVLNIIGFTVVEQDCFGFLFVDPVSLIVRGAVTATFIFTLGNRFGGYEQKYSTNTASSFRFVIGASVVLSRTKRRQQ